jgi:hypothetical protein
MLGKRLGRFGIQKCDAARHAKTDFKEPLRDAYSPLGHR